MTEHSTPLPADFAPHTAEKNAVMRATLDQALYDKNLQFFADHFPGLAVRLRSLRASSAFLFHPDDDAQKIDLMVNGQSYFGGDVYALAREDVAKIPELLEFLPHLKLGMLTPNEQDVDDVQKQAEQDVDNILYTAFRTFCAAQAIDIDAAVPRKTYPAQLVVFGVGLGCIVEQLVHHSRVKSLLILEQNLESLHHSLFVVDYAQLHQHHLENDGYLVIEMIDQEDMSVERIYNFCREHHFSYLAAGRLMFHNRRLYNKAFVQALLKQMLLGLASKGFFVDQMIMLRQQAENLHRYRMPLLIGTTVTPPKVACIVVGNGPSLNHSAKVISQYADQAVIISCGSALGSLLKRGITPDFHVETENTLATEKIILDMAEKYDLSGIHLLQATTVRHRVGACFDRATAFTRSGVYLFSSRQQKKQTALPNCEPTVGNAGLAVAAKLGFSRIYLFGLDMGTVDQQQFHASGGVYDKEELQRYGLLEKHAMPDLLPMPLPANFGGDAYCSDITLFALPYLELAAKVIRHHYSVQLFNCSDGVRLKHIPPMLPETLELHDSHEDKQATLQTLQGRTIRIDELDEAKWHFCALYDSLLIEETFALYRQKIDSLVTPVTAETDFPLFALLTEFERIFEQRGAYRQSLTHYHAAVHFAISGSMYRWSQLYFSCDANVPLNCRQALADTFIAFLRDMINMMQQELMTLCADMADIRAQYLTALNITPPSDTPLAYSIVDSDKV